MYERAEGSHERGQIKASVRTTSDFYVTPLECTPHPIHQNARTLSFQSLTYTNTNIVLLYSRILIVMVLPEKFKSISRPSWESGTLMSPHNLPTLINVQSYHHCQSLIMQPIVPEEPIRNRN